MEVKRGLTDYRLRVVSQLGNPGALANLVDVARLENEDQSFGHLPSDGRDDKPFWLDLSHEKTSPDSKVYHRR